MKNRAIGIFKRFTAILVISAMIIAMMPNIILAEEIISFADGDGTEGNPYQIENAEQLEYMAEKVNADIQYAKAHYKLMADIAMPEAEEGQSNHTAIGASRYPFLGTFNGSGKSISGIVINKPNGSYQGLFGYIGENGVVKDVTLINANIKVKNYVGGIAGENRGTVDNCSYSGTISGTDTYGVYVGGIAGTNYNTVKNCTNKGNVTGNRTSGGFTYIGGVVGQNKGIVEDGNNSGAISAKGGTSGFTYTGGIVGENNGTVKNSGNNGTVIARDINVVTYTGGIVGENNGTIENSNNSGHVNEGRYTGGIAGENNGTIENSNNSGDVSGGWYTGGIAGENNGTIENSRNSGDVTGNSYTGGVVGYNYNGTIKDSGNSGDVRGSSYTGGVVGYNYNATIENSNNSGDVRGSSYTGGVVGKNNGTVENSNNSGDVSGGWYTGGVIGDDRGTVKNCFYIYIKDIETTYNDIKEELGIEVEKYNPNENIEFSYQWYKYDSGTGKGTKVTGATNEKYSIPRDLNAGDYYYYGDVTIQWVNETGENKALTATCDIAAVMVNKATPTLPEIPVFEASYGETLKSLALPDWDELTPPDENLKNYIRGTFSWQDENTPVGNVDDNINYKNAVFTPDDEYIINYKVVKDVKVGIDVAPIIIKRTNLSWKGIMERIYNKEKSNVRAFADNILNKDEYNIIIADGDAINAGLHKATANGVDNNNYKLDSEYSVYYIINKADPEYIIPKLTAIYGETLEKVELPSGFSWEDATDILVGNVGKNTFKVSYTPEDTNNYNILKGIEVEINVEKAIPYYSIPTNLKATYGDTLDDIELTQGFSWQDKISTSVGNAGKNKFLVTYTPRDIHNYKVVSDIEVIVDVAPKVIESIDLKWTGIENRVYDGKKSNVKVSAENLVGDDTCNINVIGGDAIDAGSYTATVGELDNRNYQLGGRYSATYNIDKANPDYITPTDLVAGYGQTLADVSLPKGFSWEENTSTLVGTLGNNAFSVRYAPEDTKNYNEVGGIEVIIKVGKGIPMYSTPSGLTATYGQSLGDVELPEGFSWQAETNTSVGNAGENKFMVTYTPKDTNHYKVVLDIDVIIRVSKVPTEFVYVEKDKASGVIISGLEDKINIPEKELQDVEEVTISIKSNKANEDSANMAIIKNADEALKEQKYNLLDAFDISVVKRVVRIDGTVEESRVPNRDIMSFITVRIPIPEEYKGKSNLAVAFIADGANVEMLRTKHVTIDGQDYLEFETNHFSIYAIVELNVSPNGDPEESDNEESGKSKGQGSNNTSDAGVSDVDDAEVSDTDNVQANDIDDVEANESGEAEAGNITNQLGEANSQEESKGTNRLIYYITGFLIIITGILLYIKRKRKTEVV